MLYRFDLKLMSDKYEMIDIDKLSELLRFYVRRRVDSRFHIVAHPGLTDMWHITTASDDHIIYEPPDDTWYRMYTFHVVMTRYWQHECLRWRRLLHLMQRVISFHEVSSLHSLRLSIYKNTVGIYQVWHCFFIVSLSTAYMYAQISISTVIKPNCHVKPCQTTSKCMQVVSTC